MKRMLILIALALALSPLILSLQAQPAMACESPFDVRECDINKDGFVGIDDIFIVASAFGISICDEQWCEVEKCDLDKDNCIGMTDIFLVAANFGLQFYD